MKTGITKFLCPLMLPVLLWMAGLCGANADLVYGRQSPPLYYAPVADIQRPLDIDGDGVVDFLLKCDLGGAYLVSLGTNSVIGIPEEWPDAGSMIPALSFGDIIGADPALIDVGFAWVTEALTGTAVAIIGADVTIDGELYYDGFWSGRDAYVGLRFENKSGTHYGWLELTNDTGIASGQVLGWGYDTRPGISLKAGATGGAPPFESVGLPDRFVCTLAASGSNTVLFAGAGGFQVDCTQLRFVLNVADPFTNIEAAMLTTPSRQVRVDLGPGQPVAVSLFAPVQVIGQGTSAATSPDLDFLYPALQYSGQIPLTETLLREIQAGQAELTLYLPGEATSPFDRYQPDALAQGSLLALPQPGATNPAACWPRAPRSTTVRYTPGPAVGFPWVSFGTATVDLDGDGQPDYNLGGNALCTASIPACCTTWFEATGVSSNELLVLGQDLAVVEIGTSLGPEPQSGAAWSSAGGFLTETGSGCGYHPWSGELGRRGEGYLGARLRRSDGDHYGWMRVVLAGSALSSSPGFIFLGPVVVDWAFELQPGVATVAGARSYPAAVASLGILRPGYLRTRVATEPGWSYAVQQRGSITQGNWQSAGFSFVGDSSETLLDLPMTGGTGFFRVVEAD